MTMASEIENRNFSITIKKTLNGFTQFRS